MAAAPHPVSVSRYSYHRAHSYHTRTEDTSLVATFPDMTEPLADEPRADAESLARYLEVAEAAARGAGGMIREAHEKRSLGLGVESKGSAETHTVDLVTATDKACEEYIFNKIKESFPTHVLIGEESSFTAPGTADASVPLELTDTPTWIVVSRSSPPPPPPNRRLFAA